LLKLSIKLFGKKAQEKEILLGTAQEIKTIAGRQTRDIEK